MLSLLKRYRELLIVGFLLLLPLVRLMGQKGVERAPSWIDRLIIGASAPLQRGLVWAVDEVREGFSSYVMLRHVREDNARLSQQNSQLGLQLSQFIEVQLENQRLRSMLEFSKAHEGKKIAAKVLGVNPVATLLSVRIDKGEKEGTARGMPVVTFSGVIGHILRTTEHTSDVLLMTDTNSRMGVLLQKSRARATAQGAGANQSLQLENVLRAENLSEGETVLTSGTDGVFPSGLMVGQVASVQQTKHGMFQTAVIVPAVDMNKLEEVFVIAGSAP